MNTRPRSEPAPQFAKEREPLAWAAPALIRTFTVIVTAIASATIIVLGGCASSTGIVPVAKPIEPASVGLGAAATGPNIDLAWWQGFGDESMAGLIERALADNPDLKVAQARIARADAGVASARSAEGVQADASLDVSRQRFSATGIYPPPLGGSTLTLGSAQLSASWEFDFFGRNRAAIEAAIGTRRTAQAEAQAARNLLASQVARTYVQLGRLMAQREVAQGSLKQREETLAVIRQRVRAGIDTNVELRQGEGALPESRQQIEQLDEQIMLTRHALATLTAQPPDGLDGLTASLGTLKPVDLPAAVPADLLGRRADVAAARSRAQVAASVVKGAKAQFYPNINLTAFAGLSSIGLNKLVSSGSEQYGFGPAIELPIFDAGRLRANLRARTAELDAAIESYNTTVLEAVRDAADQIGSLRSLQRQQAAQTQAQAAAESAYDLALQRYRAGLSSYLVVLSAETSVLSQRRLAVDLNARTLDTQVALIRALGGGYQGEAELPARAASADR
jgi:NodT family efflux transporter outer membrane factor (OMF) lipoprotein